jgi:predicted nucleic-acid-binding Zn-ribbon protein
MRMTTLEHYRCLRCGHTGCEIGRDFGLDWAGTRFATVTCTRCRHTEFFAAKPDELPALFDIIAGSKGDGRTGKW